MISSGICRIAAVLAVVVVPVVAVAQVIPPSEQPGRERERFIEPAPPRAKPGVPAISVPSAVAPEDAEKIRFVLREVTVVGSSVYGLDNLSLLYHDLIGREVSLRSVYDIAQRITAKYGNDGYVLSRAIVPPQQLDPDGAVVRIEIIEGFIDKVQWPTELLARYRDFFSSYTDKITAARPANIHVIERYLLLASDLPGLRFSSSLKPAPESPRASTLVVEVSKKSFDANIRLDNRGTRARGPNQFFTSATANNPFGNHEALTVSYAGVYSLKELQYLAGNYRQILTSEGLTAFVNASYGWGRPGTADLELLNFSTRSTLLEAGLSYPLIRARERNLALTGLMFMNDSHSDLLSAPFNEDRLRGLRFRADADAVDVWRGVNQVAITFSQGINGVGATNNGNPLASRALGRVDFAKLEAYLSHTQPLVANFSAAVAGFGQYAFTSLLAPEQCGFGGRTFGRAFDPSQLLADRCWEVLGELRYDIPTTSAPLSLAQLYSFTDYGKLYTISPAVGAASVVDAASAGLGLRLGWQTHSVLDISAVKAIEGPRNDWRLFFGLTWRY